MLITFIEISVSQFKISKQITYCVLLGAPHFPVASINILFVFPVYSWKYYSRIKVRESMDNFTDLKCNTPMGQKNGQSN